MKKKTGRNWGKLGGGMLVALLLLIPVLIVLAINWEYPGKSELGDSLWFYAALPTLIGAVLAPAGISVYAFEKRGTEDCTVPVTAQIVEIKEERQINGDVHGTYMSYTPVYRYRLNGEIVEVKGRGYSANKKKYTVGQLVPMLVAPGKPKQYRVEKESRKTFRTGKILAFIGLALLAAGVLLWLGSVGIWLTE